MANIGALEIDARANLLQVALPPGEQIIDDDDAAGALGKQFAYDGGADEARLTPRQIRFSWAPDAWSARSVHMSSSSGTATFVTARILSNDNRPSANAARRTGSS